MCGIAGIIGLESDRSENLIKGMCNAIAHRGPDAEGVFINGKLAFGHRRLSIIDLNHGADQPFKDVSGRYVIVFNGEIYNYKEVKSLLSYPWKTSSDTEVILAAYIQWGKECLSYLNGMFAFAIWDIETQELFITRDRLGVKPLYYSLKDGVFIFASEIRSILSTALLEKRIDKRALADFLANMTVKTPYSIIEGIQQLCPGEFAVLKDKTLSKEFYWSILGRNSFSDKKTNGRAEIIKTVRTMFQDSIKSRLVADVKVGAFLSGGIDSSAVVACMAGISETPVETFSIVFDDKTFDESEYSRKIAEKYKTTHTEFLLEPKELINNLPGYIASMDTPTVDGINTYMVSKLVANTGIKVVLTGIGGDELFAGYRSFRRWSLFQKLGFIFKNPFVRIGFNSFLRNKNNRVHLKLSDMFDRKSNSLRDFYSNSRAIYLKEEIDRLLETPGAEIPNWIDLNGEQINEFPVYSKYSIAELSNYTLDVLMKDTDQMSMAWALEVREPFFDYKLIEYVLTIPDSEKWNKKTPKNILVEAMGELLPEEIVYRPKKGFTFPWETWLRNDLKTFCESSVRSLAERGIMKKTGVLYIWESFLERKNAITWMHVWSLVILEQWIKENNITD